MDNRLIIHRISRMLVSGGIEALDFEPGVNVIVGPANSGKTTWLRMLDFLMGDNNSAAGLFDEEIIRKYAGVATELEVSEQRVVIERRWSADGGRSQMTVDGKPFPANGLQEWLLEGLGIPTVRYPQGNLYSDRTWSTLSWRSLLRHIYRRQDFWSDLVPRQPDSERHACLLQFLGVAQHLFSDEYALLIEKRRRIAQLQARKDSFVETLNQISADLVVDASLSVGITSQSIAAARERLMHEILELVGRRDALLTKIRNETAEPGGQLGELLNQRLTLLRQRDDFTSEIESVEARLRELAQYRSLIEKERDRLTRAEVAAAAFEDIRITHCPACDQSVEDRPRTVGPMLSLRTGN
jgi:DNA repair ATPase RecN